MNELSSERDASLFWQPNHKWNRLVPGDYARYLQVFLVCCSNGHLAVAWRHELESLRLWQRLLFFQSQLRIPAPRKKYNPKKQRARQRQATFRFALIEEASRRPIRRDRATTTSECLQRPRRCSCNLDSPDF